MREEENTVVPPKNGWGVWGERNRDIPVEAVMATASGDLTCFFLRLLIISRSRTDFPVPVGSDQPIDIALQKDFCKETRLYAVITKTHQHYPYKKHYARQSPISKSGSVPSSKTPLPASSMASMKTPRLHFLPQLPLGQSVLWMR
jgi:hypothetical protein